MAYTLKPIVDSWLKLSTAQGSTLPEEQRQFINAGTVLPLSSFELVGDDHIKITLGQNAQGQQLQFKGRNTWYVYRPSIQILRDGQVVTLPNSPSPIPIYSLKPLTDTWLKLSTVQGSTLPDSQRQFIAGSTLLPLESYAPAEDDHLKVTLGKDAQGRTIQFKGRNTWYVYRPTVQILRDGQVIVSPAPTPTPSSSGRINAKGLRLLKSFEGLRLTAYQDSVGVWTIGYGTTTGVRPGMVITEAQAEELLRRDLIKFERAVSDLVDVPLTADQFSALVSFTYNVGEGALASSTLLRLLNQKDYQGAADQFLRWDKAGGQTLPGLTRRRSAERALFLGQS